MKYSYYTEYYITDSLSINGNINYYSKSHREYINDTLMFDLDENDTDFNIGMNYEWLLDFISPPLEISLGYPDQAGLYISGSLIRDPVIFSVGMDYKNILHRKVEEIGIICGLGFLANDSISFKLTMASHYLSNHKPPVISSSLSTSYLFDPENHRSITFNNTFQYKDKNVNLISGITISF